MRSKRTQRSGRGRPTLYIIAFIALAVVMAAGIGWASGMGPFSSLSPSSQTGQNPSASPAHTPVAPSVSPNSSLSPSSTPASSATPTTVPSASPGVPSGEAASWPNVPGLSVAQQQEVVQRIAAMSLDEKIGQLVIAGMDGTKPGANTQKLIDQYHIGGFILFRDNMQTVQGTVTLLNGLKEANHAQGGEPLFLGVDEEGGRVSRLPKPVTPLPASGEIGKTGSTAYARDIGKLLARRIKAFGFNVDFAPVLDVNSNPNNPVIGDRSFSSSSPEAAKLGTAAMLGIKSEGIMGVVKHFPGHGDTSVDSHKQLPIQYSDMSRLQKVELPPFETAFQEGADAVMVAHILLPKLDSKYPASMSESIITGLLRDGLHYQGLVISDDLTMGAIKDNYDLGEAAVRSITAGGDIVLVCHGNEDIIHVLQKLRQAVSSGTIPEKRLNESMYRILARKTLYGLNDQSIASVNVNQLNQDTKMTMSPYQ